MLIAAIETSTLAVSVAIADEDGLVARFDAPRGRRHSETVIPALDAVLKLGDRTRADITAMAVDVGPGMFTGLRVGVTTAITLAYALDVPVVTVGSLEMLAWRLSLDGAFTGRIGTVLDARRKECFAEVFDITPGEAPVSLVAAAPLSPADVAALLQTHGCTQIVGDAAAAYPSAFAEFSVLAPFRPDAATAAVVATRQLDRAVAADAVTMRYLREPDAEIPKDLR